MVIVGLGMSVMRHIPTPTRSLTHALLGPLMVFPLLIGSSRARTSPGLSATLPYEGRDLGDQRGARRHDSGSPLLVGEGLGVRSAPITQ